MRRPAKSPHPGAQVCAHRGTGAEGPSPPGPPRPFSDDSRGRPTSDENVHTLCRRLGRGHCACAAHGTGPCRELRSLLGVYGSVEAAHEAELKRLERIARNART
ncbi:hypothetical protein SAMN06297129_3000 [Pseudooceanicola antarcticus]|uniref:Uncharacterized protein n=1 Tax=Pseudooceanicola antarcticus TaxID=1247613 RepID=A0A285J5C5_9RHOB|nr:hypothetical protein SAMN06297129_3000 [Pseudooceanicola antarcticus]